MQLQRLAGLIRLMLPVVALSLSSPAKIVFDRVAFRYDTPWWRPLVSSTPRRRSNAVEDLHWTWEGPLVLLLLGDSSSGKSTVLQLIANPHLACEGSISVEGDTSYFTMAKFGNEPAVPLWKLLPTDGDKLLEAAGLEGCKEKVPHGLTPSERYRFELARRASNGKNIFLLDEWLDNEPTDIVRKVEQAIHNITRETAGVACIVTHRPERFLCQNRVTLSFGRTADVKVETVDQ